MIKVLVLLCKVVPLIILVVIVFVLSQSLSPLLLHNVKNSIVVELVFTDNYRKFS